jgi:hypothetical protein
MITINLILKLWLKKLWIYLLFYALSMVLSFYALQISTSILVPVLILVYSNWLLMILFKGDSDQEINNYYKILNIPKDSVLFVKILNLSLLAILQVFILSWRYKFNLQILLFIHVGLFYMIFHLERIRINKFVKLILSAFGFIFIAFFLAVVASFFANYYFMILSTVLILILIVEIKNTFDGKYSRV